MYNSVDVRPGTKNYMFGGVSSRPTLRFDKDERTDVKSRIVEKMNQLDQLIAERSKEDQLKSFGMFSGVISRCLLNIWGVILFVRLGWVVGNAGILHASIIIVISFLLTMGTALSLSAICTNGEVGGGGTYYLISRALGPEWGASVGIIFSLANAIALSIYLLGFSETVLDIIGHSGVIFSSDAADLRFIGIIALLLLTVLCFVGVGWVVKIDSLQLAILVTAILFTMIGTFTSTPDSSLGFTGYAAQTFSENWNPSYETNEDFLSIFSVFFPAMTGMLAGANISAELKDPQRSIPIGTMIAVSISSAAYLMVVWMLGCTVQRIGTSSNSGLYKDFLIMPKVSIWAPLVYVGIFASTLSSALASIVGAPRILMAVCKDGLLPPLNYFAKSRKKDNEPVRGYILTFAIGFAFVMIGNLNAIAPIITQFFLFNRVLINYSCFEAAWSKSPGWRPTFKYYSPLLSLLCAILCIVIMFAINWWAALVTLSLGILLYQYVQRLDLDVNFGESRRGVVFKAATSSLAKLQTIPYHAKTWRPLYLVLARSDIEREHLLLFTDYMRSGYGVVYDGHVQTGTSDQIGGNKNQPNTKPSQTHMNVRGMPSKTLSFSGVTSQKKFRRSYFKEAIVVNTFLEGCKILMQTAGIDGIRPNTVLIDISSWLKESTNDSTRDLMHMVISALRLRYGVAALYGIMPLPNIEQQSSIDVWWLADTGGLTILMPYLLTQHPSWTKSEMRVFLQGRPHEIGALDVDILRLMKMLRIKVSHIEHVDLTLDPPVKAWGAYSLPELEQCRDHLSKMSHYLCLNNAIKQHSNRADAIFVTLPLPQPSRFSEFQYLQWLDAIVRDVQPPIVFVRGNQTEVLAVHA